MTAKEVRSIQTALETTRKKVRRALDSGALNGQYSTWEAWNTDTLYLESLLGRAITRVEEGQPLIDRIGI